MAAIFEFAKPLVGGVAYHRFLLLQDDAGSFTYIARGGPFNPGLAPYLGSSGVSGSGFGNLVVDVQPYSQIMSVGSY